MIDEVGMKLKVNAYTNPVSYRKEPMAQFHAELATRVNHVTVFIRGKGAAWPIFALDVLTFCTSAPMPMFSSQSCSACSRSRFSPL